MSGKGKDKTTPSDDTGDLTPVFTQVELDVRRKHAAEQSEKLREQVRLLAETTQLKKGRIALL